jgi:hypothetical protein
VSLDTDIILQKGRSMLFLLQISLKIKVSIRFRYKKQGSF